VAEEATFENLFQEALSELTKAEESTDEAPALGQAEEAQDETAEEVIESETDGEAEAETEEVEETAESSNEEATSKGPIAVTESDVIVLPDGTEVSVKEATLRQADYTRKTQALADERKAIEAEREVSRSQIEYVENLTKAWQTNQAEVVSGFVASTEDPTLTISQVIVELAKADKLDPKFLETFGITKDVQEKWVEETKSNSELTEIKNRLSRFEQERIQQDSIARQQAEEAALVQEYENQWAQIKVENRLNLDPTQEVETKLNLLRYALDNDLTNLKVAYKAFKFEESQKATNPKKAATSAKKEATGVITAKSTGGSVAVNRPPSNIEDAAWAAFQELTSKQ
jgi:hypothetical protein